MIKPVPPSSSHPSNPQRPCDIKSTLRTVHDGDDAFLEHLLRTNMDPARHLPCIRPLITAQLYDSLPTVFRRLSIEGILSCPILDANKFIGFISLFDIVLFITEMHWGQFGEDWQHFEQVRAL